MPKVKGRNRNMLNRKTKKKAPKKRPPRIFIRKGKIYVRIGKKKYLLKDQNKYSKNELMDIILKNLSIRRKRRKKHGLTKREKKLNKSDMKAYTEFERLNRTQSGKTDFKTFSRSSRFLPLVKDAGAGAKEGVEKSFYKALVKFSDRAPLEDINLKNRKKPEIKKTEVKNETPDLKTPPKRIKDRFRDTWTNAGVSDEVRQMKEEIATKGRKQNNREVLKRWIRADPELKKLITLKNLSTEDLFDEIVGSYITLKRPPSELAQAYFAYEAELSIPSQDPIDKGDAIPFDIDEEKEGLSSDADDDDELINLGEVNFHDDSDGDDEGPTQGAAGKVSTDSGSPVVNRLTDGLKTSEINKMMSTVKNYLGTYPADFLKFLPKKLSKIFSFIMNTDPSTKNGKHWVAVRVDTSQDMAIEYYDSFAQEPSKDFMKQLKKLVDRLDINVYLKMKINRIQQQNTNTTNCGWFAMKFIIDRELGGDFKQCSGFNDSIKGESDIEKFKIKFSYI